MLLALSISALVALQPLPAVTTSRRAVLTAAPLAASSAAAANAFNPLDILFGWIPPVEPAKTDETQVREKTTAEKIRERKKQLMAEEVEKQQAEYMRNRGNSAASVQTDAAGAARAGN